MNTKQLLEEFGSRQLNPEELTAVQAYVLNHPGSIRKVIEAMRKNAMKELHIDPENDFMRPYLQDDEDSPFAGACILYSQEPQAMAESRASMSDDEIWAAISKELFY